MASFSLTISDVRAQAVVVPLARPVRTAVGTIASAPLVLIDVQTKEGVVGSAYIFAYTGAALASLHRLVIDIGAELRDKPARPHDLMRFFDRRFRLLGWQGLVGMAISGIDMAVWDALGHALEQPVAALLGASPKAIAAYDSYGVIDPKTDLPALEASIQRGFRAIKIKLGDGSLDNDVAIVSVVRDVIGPDIKLMVDYNQALDAPEAIRRIGAIERFAPYWVEEPVKAEDLQGHRAVRKSVSTAIQTGENWWFPAGMAASLAAEASDFVMPDIMKIGGVTGWIEAASLAASVGAPLSSHIFTEASAHVLAATPTAHFIEHLDLAGELLEHPVEVVDGKVTARGPGLGLMWKKDAVKRFLAPF